MRAGLLRHRIWIERQVESQAADGSIAPNWKRDFQLWANVTPKSGKEKFEAQAVASEVTHEIHIRAPANPVPFTAKHRVSFKERIFHISSVVNVGERNRELILMCVEGAPNG